VNSKVKRRRPGRGKRVVGPFRTGRGQPLSALMVMSPLAACTNVTTSPGSAAAV